MNSVSASSTTRPPTSMLDLADRIANLRQRDVVGAEPARSTTTAYWRTKPPTLATSATPSALATAKRTCQSCVARSSASVRLAAMTAYW